MMKNRKRYSGSGWGKIILISFAISIVFGFLFDFAVSQIEFAIYPKAPEYAVSVERYSERFNVPEELIWAVIKTESGFNSSAVSDKGAVGLMQLTESTFNEISTQRLKEGLDPGMRYDPDTNIRYGTYYLSYLYARYNNWDAALAAYNGGLGNVDDWVDGNGKLSVNDIPFKETRNYVKKVNRAREKYEDLY